MDNLLSGLASGLKSWFTGEGETNQPKDTSLDIPIQRRHHARAKRLKLTIRAGQVWLTIPPRCSEKQIQQFLAHSKPWLASQQHHIRQVNESTNTPDMTVALHGTALAIPLLNTTWQISLTKGINIAFEVANTLYVPEENSVAHIREHIRRQGKIYLPNRLQALAMQHRFNFKSCTIRHATTRWGSCSSQRTINLNAALMLLPTDLIDYVLLHELCHTIEMNHSAAFWLQMSRVMPDWQQKRHALKQVNIPTWWHAMGFVEG